jgi:dolichol-phosphate mannosyltransferase
MNIVHIIPTFNEKENIGRMIETIFRIGAKYPRWHTFVLVVDDHSPDGTAKVVETYKKKNPRIFLLTKQKEGLGKALIMGYEYAVRKLKADVVVPNDADFQWDPNDYPKLITKIEEGYDVAVASRHVPGGKVVGWNWFRILNHEISNTFLAWFVAGVHEVRDHAGNFKAIRVHGILDRVKLTSMKNAGFSFQLHILYELSKTHARFVEVPSSFRERRFGRSKIGLNRYYVRDVLEYLRSSCIIRMDRNSSFFKYCFVGVVGFFIQAVISKLLIMVNINPGVAVTIGAEGAIVSNFVINNMWTFSHKKIAGSSLIGKFLQFNGVSIGSMLIQGAVVGIGTQVFGKDAWFLLMVFAIIFVVIPYSYFMYSRFIWKTNTKGERIQSV